MSNDKVMGKKLLNIQEAADYIGYKKSYVYKMLMDGKLPFLKPNNGKVFFEKDRLDAWLFSSETKSASEKEVSHG